MFRIDPIPFVPERSAAAASTQGGGATQHQQHPPSAAATAEATGTSTSPPLHCCIRTALHSLTGADDDENNALITAGRKNCDVTFGEDRCVSRRHLRLRLVVHPSILEDDDSSEDAGILRKSFRPRDDEEMEAASTAVCGTAVVLDDLGSKFGTSFLEEVEGGAADPVEKADDDSATTDDDATDDGADDAAAKGGGGGGAGGAKTMRVRQLKANESVILRSLSRPVPLPSSSDATTTNNGIGTVTIKVGISGSAIRITRLPLTMCFSKSSSDSKALMKTAYRTGAEVISSGPWDVRRCTHLVTSHRSSSAKTIAAWACRRPIVTPDYLQALLERTEPNSSLPDEGSYEPSGDDFTGGVDPTAPRDVLRNGAVVFLVKNEDIESLVEAGGATVVRSYDLSDEDFFSPSDHDNWLDSIRKGVDAVAFVDTTSKKVKKRRQHLLKVGGVHRTGAKEIASAMTQLGPLKSSDGTVILEPPPPSPQEGGKERAEVGDDVDGDERDGGGTGAEAAIPVESANARVRDEGKAPVAAAAERDVVADGTSGTGPAVVVRDEGYVVAMDEDDEDVAIAAAAAAPDDEVEEKDDDGGGDDGGRPSPGRNERDDDGENVAPPSRRSAPPPPPSPAAGNGKRRRLPAATGDGWMSAAPSGAGRAAYRSLDNHNPRPSQMDGEDGGDGGVFVEAETEGRSDLVVREYRRDGVVNGGAGRRRRGFNRRRHRQDDDGKPNFKRFRKNFVLHHFDAADIMDLNLQAVLPRESERRLQLEISQRDMEREERLADALFADPYAGGGGGGGRRRGAGGGGGGGDVGIQRFFNPQKKKGSRAAASSGRSRR